LLSACGGEATRSSLGAVPASAHYQLSCDDDNIFEGPLRVTIQGQSASAVGSFDGPGSAIFDVHYKDLVVQSLQTGAEHKISSVTIAEAQSAGHRSGFQLTLTAIAGGKLKGKVTMVSTDHDKIPYDGLVTCVVH
jgi:hypothetical protein